jgi:hypothetical protein
VLAVMTLWAGSKDKGYYPSQIFIANDHRVT